MACKLGPAGSPPHPSRTAAGAYLTYQACSVVSYKAPVAATAACARRSRGEPEFNRRASLRRTRAYANAAIDKAQQAWRSSATTRSSKRASRATCLASANASTRELTLSTAGPGGSYPLPQGDSPLVFVGDSIRLYRPDYTLASAELTVESLRPAPASFRPPSTTSSAMSWWRYPESGTKFWIAAVKEPLPAGTGFDHLVSSRNSIGRGFVVRNVTVRDHRARGMLLMSDDGLVEGCHVDGSTLGGIVCTPEVWDSNADFMVSQRHLPPYFLGHFSPVLRRLFAVLSRFPASWRQDGENGRKMA